MSIAVFLRHDRRHLRDDVPAKAGVSLVVLGLVRAVARRGKHGVERVDLCTGKDLSEQSFVFNGQ